MARRRSTGELYSNKALFERSRDPVFVLNPRRRLRYVNPAFEELAGQSLGDLYNLHCIRDRRASPLAQMLAPPPDVMAGGIGSTRRPVPPARVGPPWWDISFLPLAGKDGLLGIIGRIHVVLPVPKAKPLAIPEAIVQLRHRLRLRFSFSGWDSEVPAVMRAQAQARVAAQNLAPVLLLGAPATGKQWLARTIHHHGITAERSFLSIDCAGLPSSPVESLLFGAAGLAHPERIGTVFLRLPSALPREVQARIVAWHARSSTPGPRWIVSFRRDPRTDVADRRILREFVTAFDVQRIELPPLAERATDLPFLIDRMAERHGKPAVSPDAMAIMSAYTWPGNLRELDAVIAAAAKGNAIIEPAHLPGPMQVAAKYMKQVAPAAPRIVPLQATTEQFQRRVVLLALRQARGQRNEAARLLDLSRTELWRRMRQLGIGEDDWRSVTPREGGGNAAAPDRRV